MKPMILITGAGGKTGKMLARSLSKVGSVCAFVHRDEYVPHLISCGAEKVVVGDLDDDSTLRSALQGVQAIYHICPNMHPDEAGIGKIIIQEAQKAGVEHFVYHSVLHPQTEKMKHHWQKLRVEEMLFESGLPFTILQPAPYMQNLLASWKSVTEYGILRIPYSARSKFSFVDLEDIAEAAKIILTEPGHLNATYELAGTAPISHVEVTRMFSRILNRKVRAEEEKIDNWKLRAKGMSEYAINNLVRMFEYYDQWGLAGNPNVLKWVLKRDPTSLETFVDRIIKTHDEIH